MDCSAQISALLSKGSELPPELVDIIRTGSNASFLAAVTSAALEPQWTDTIFTHLEPLFPEICAQWVLGHGPTQALPAFARILHFAPHLAEYAEAFLGRHPTSIQDIWSMSAEEMIVELLLAIFRILVFDCKSFGRYLDFSKLYPGLNHDSRPIRYLTVRIICVYLHGADAAMEDMVARYLGENVIYGLWEGKNIDYRFLSLWEEKRWRDSRTAHNLVAGTITSLAEKSSDLRVILPTELSPLTAEIFGSLLPRVGGAPSIPSNQKLVPTSTTITNVRSFTKALLQPEPVLLAGMPGAGKTAIVNFCALQLNKAESMVTLHLNEQSDAKMLVGMYTSGSSPGTFVWRPGALTTAVREGRWVFIEDLDRAPNEIISTLLPLIERRELLIPSRGEVIQASRGFKIIATMRTTYDMRGGERLLKNNMIGSRLWNQVSVKTLSDEELAQIISSVYPSLAVLCPRTISVYSRLRTISNSSGFASTVRTGSVRPLTPRDLFKWCHRIQHISSYSEGFLDQMFLEAVDCFAGYLPSGDVFQPFAACIAEELHIDPLRRDHILQNRDVSFTSTGNQLSIGRTSLSRISQQRAGRQRFFAKSPHTLRLLEKLAAGVGNREPMLLVGETGIGKTACVQYLADSLGRKLVSFNLSQQSESGDLLGGFKPVNVRGMVMPLYDEFDELFTHKLSPFGKKKTDNKRFTDMLRKAIASGQWKKVCTMWKSAVQEVQKNFIRPATPASGVKSADIHSPRKKRRVEGVYDTEKDEIKAVYRSRWNKFAADVKDLDSQLASRSDLFAFKFVEGNIVKALRNGDWVLLDEINLAAPDTLEALVDLLGGSSSSAPSLLLTETGNIERIVAHPNFRIFAAMNPATDVGKKDLPPGIRSRFTEIYVDSPDCDIKSLQSIVQSYLDADLGRHLVGDVTNLYLEIQKLADANALIDGAGQRPHFSLRTLTRTLIYARDIAGPVGAKDGIYRRALYEGFHMSFSTLLDSASEKILAPKIMQHLFGKHQNARAELNKALPQPNDGHSYVQDHHYWLRKGNLPLQAQPHYIITPFVRRNLDNLTRAVSTRKLPILIQGPTSSGKTSMIEYLAKKTGNKFVRINNHEHTDLQEYLGTYVSGTDGKLHFQEGVLVEALRGGYWVVLDELNLAPTDVLEALNRLLDDNRELFIPETQETIQPHPDFILFATQNPAGLYGGRKHLSRAFRNRFLELHFDDIPVDELCDILHQRTEIPRSWSQRIVDTYRELSTLRQENRLFEQKSFATLRDLFRWALRQADTVQQLASNGYMLLAERVRKPEEREKVKSVIEQVMSRKGPRVQISEQELYASSASKELENYQLKHGTHGVVWTKSMQRLFYLVASAIRNNEPVLLVGETGCGKTTVCQMLADALRKELFVVNAHQNTETGDLIGSQRPVRNRAIIQSQLCEQLSFALRQVGIDIDGTDTQLETLLRAYDGLDSTALLRLDSNIKQNVQALRVKWNSLFEWSDGSLVRAMKTGQFFLLDEISLADDSVLERLNSVLESQRSILLAEKGPIDSSVTAVDGFQFLATMNPGGDYGKRELSPALRNRFTEIWVPSLYDMEDILQIVRAKLNPAATEYADAVVKFSQWFNQSYNTSSTSAVSIRDTLAWVEFINRFSSWEPVFAILHGAAMVYIDTLGANPASMLSISSATIDQERRNCVTELEKLLGQDLTTEYFTVHDLRVTEHQVGIGRFALPRAPEAGSDPSFTFNAATTRSNAMRVFRALQLNKPILIEGNPGVGKTTLVTAIAKSVGKRLTRINLSEQTDLMDLFGSDVPVEGANVGSFAWRDAPFLSAMKNGDWVLLDEMNLASQSVLEGLNACLDHRAEAYIAELDQTFQRHPNFRLFAAQNPHHQGGGRKGLPASFVNRFTVVYADVFKPDDLLLICKQVFPEVAEEQITNLTRFVDQLDTDAVQSHRFGAQGSPWEFNLRDTLRWLQLLTSRKGLLRSGRLYDFCDIVFRQRFRNNDDRKFVDSLYSATFRTTPSQRSFYHNLAIDVYQVGLGLTNRDTLTTTAKPTLPSLWRYHLPVIESLMICAQENWPVILVGPSGSGKTTILENIAAVSGSSLVSFPMNADIDAMDLVGGYEQADPSRRKTEVLSQLKAFVECTMVSAVVNGDHKAIRPLMDLLQLTFLSSNPSKQDLAAIKVSLQMLAESHKAIAANHLIDLLTALLSQPDQIEKAQFEWVDGLLVQCLQRGDWLVLDNANLCNASVLDRLNSLLEPNGYLSINEHPLEDGEGRIIKPHPNFRVFLTMDPRNGELSRAMRNRAVEIFVLPAPDKSTEIKENSELFALESFTHRFRNIAALDERNCQEGELLEVAKIATDHISFQDVTLQSRFQEQLSQGLLQDGPIQAQINSSLHLLSTISEALFCSPRSVPSSSMLESKNKNEPIHPLNNEILVRQSQQATFGSRWLAEAYDILVDLSKMEDAFTEAVTEARSRRPITLFDRSIHSNRFPQAATTPTIHIAPFLEASLRTMKEYIGDQFNKNQLLSNEFHVVKVAQRFWWDIFHLVNSNHFEEAVYQIHLSLAQADLLQLQKTLPSEPEFTGLQLSLLSKMSEVTGLTTGKSMERIWRTLRPKTASSMERLNAVLRLEELADRFDKQIFPLRAPLGELVRVREAFDRALRIANEEQVEIETLTRELEESTGSGAKTQKDTITEEPFFKQEFEAICEYFDITSQTSVRSRPELRNLLAQVSLLAGRPSKRSAIIQSRAPIFQQALFSIDNYLGGEANEDKPRAIHQDLAKYLVQRLRAVNQVPLSQLNQLHSELEVLGRVMAIGADTVCEEQTVRLEQVLHSISEEWRATTEEPHIQSLISPNMSAVFLCWITFSLDCIFAYVPDHPFDPALKESVQRQLLMNMKNKLRRKREALDTFEQWFSGQKGNLRAALVLEELNRLGEDIPEMQISRPSTSQLGALQGEFNGVLQIANSVQEGIKSEQYRFDPSILQNINQVINRLRHNYRAYDDIVVLLIGFLRCLSVGLTLAQVWTVQESSNDRISVQGSSLLGSLRGLGAGMDISLGIQDSTTQLNQIAIAHNIESSGSQRPQYVAVAHTIFAQLYHSWKDNVSEEQMKHAKESSLYTYRGGQDEEDQVEDEEYNALFPNYSNEGETEYETSESPREVAIRTSTLHSYIFSQGADPQKLITELICHGNRTTPAQLQQKPMATELLTIYSSLQYAKDILSSDAMPAGNYNIYKDSNVPEARKLALLVQKVQRRFKHLESLDFEHSTIDDVIRICDEIFAFAHTEPVAKFITKTEKLHETMNEWERVASRELSASSLFDDVTNLIVSWRRLELNTWIRLFDLEMEKAVQDAKSWWFVAYENIIAVPESLVNAGHSLQLHATELLKTLASFFATASLGQFQERLQLLSQFKQHVQAITADSSESAPICTALANFVAHYSRFRQPVADTLAKGRQQLEKKVREVVQLASWKDINIEALRQSAKASHRKLFRLVRKFRELLNRPVTALIEEGPPDESFPDPPRSLGNLELNLSADHQAASRACEKFFNDWDTVPSRFKNISATVSLMYKLSSHPDDTLDGTMHIKTFLNNLELSMTQLQKATPTVLTEETKDKVKHLKTRKRALFAETLKELRRMGFQYNLSSDILARQDSLATVLASVPVLSEDTSFPEIASAQYHFHKTLSLMQSVRQIQREHSGDLTPAEVARSTGYLEGILQRILLQRETLASLLADFKELEKAVAEISNLWSPGQYHLVTSNSYQGKDQPITTWKSISWLLHITKFFANIVITQAQLGKFDATAVVDGLNAWASKLEAPLKDFEGISELPSGIHSSVQQDLSNLTKELLEGFKEDIQCWTGQWPMLVPVLTQLLPWMELEVSQTNGSVYSLPRPIEETRRDVFHCADTILGSIQSLSDNSSSIATGNEDPAWLTKQDASQATLLSALHVKKVTASLRFACNTLQSLSPEHVNVAAALFGSIHPILQQYSKITRDHLEEYTNFHAAINKFSHQLCKSFVQIGKKGFCTPSEKTMGDDGQEEKLEGGTGLGEGEGAEDISKDIDDDDDLTELAQEPDSRTDREEIEDEKDAVDMADEEMEGEMGDVADKGEDDEAGEGDEGNDEIDEETGSVDDLGPSALDEKMWDDGDKAEKDKEGKDGESSKQDEKVGAEDGNKEQTNSGEEKIEEQETGGEEEEAVGQEQLEKMDEYTQQAEALDLPEDMNMDGSIGDKSDDEVMDDLDDLDNGDDGNDIEEIGHDDEPTNHGGEMEETHSNIDEDERLPEEGPDTEADVTGPDQKDEEDGAEQDESEEPDKQTQAGAHEDHADAANDAAQTQVQGIGADPNNEENKDPASDSAAAQDQGMTGEENDFTQGINGEHGSKGQASQQEAVGRDEDLQDTTESQPFKKLGDTLERWYNQQRQIRQATESLDAQSKERKRDVDMADTDFEHLLNEESQAEAQALGAASEDQARALDNENAMTTNEQELPQNSFAEDNDGTTEDDDMKMDDTELTQGPKIQGHNQAQAKSFIGDSSQQHRQDTTLEGRELSASPDVEEVDTQLSSVHLAPPPELSHISPNDARDLWAKHENNTRTLSATLTEQLRLILAPTLATKLRGDFRTGKRLNIKRIIPYIASSYKRDKIWMRRSVPSKRAYQVMIALDDSKSMAEGGSKDLAFETLALVARALSMLEVGELAITRFGEGVEITHPFDKPFTDDAGAEVFGKFAFAQEKTDVRMLVREGISIFQDARAKASSSASELWQLMLVVSDAICDDADAIRRLVRQAQEEKIMIVFIVIDAGAREVQTSDGKGKPGQSIMDLEKVEFVPDEGSGELKVRRFKYMAEVFPFRWWVVVRDVKELPGVLAAALRQWFGEVVETGS